MDSSSSKVRPLYSPKKFAEKHSNFLALGGLRDQIFYAKSRVTTRGVIPGNGLEAALVRMNRRVYIDEEKYFEWVESLQNREQIKG